jgi:hypothetical protein
VDGTVSRDQSHVKRTPKLTHRQRQIALDETALDAAKSSLVFSSTRRVASPGKAVCQPGIAESTRMALTLNTGA